MLPQMCIFNSLFDGLIEIGTKNEIPLFRICATACPEAPVNHHLVLLMPVNCSDDANFKPNYQDKMEINRLNLI